MLLLLTQYPAAPFGCSGSFPAGEAHVREDGGTRDRCRLPCLLSAIGV